MDFLANENYPLTSIKRLREKNYNVASVLEDTPGAKDHEVLSRAHKEKRVILTFDRDYGELIYRKKFPAPPGIVYFRFNPTTPLEPANILFELLNMEEVRLLGRFTVIDRKRIRQRLLPIKV